MIPEGLLVGLLKFVGKLAYQEVWGSSPTRTIVLNPFKGLISVFVRNDAKMRICIVGYEEA